MSVFKDFSTSVNKMARDYLDDREPKSGPERNAMALEIGKALAGIGGVFIGGGLGIKDPDRGLRPVHDMLAEFERIANEMN